MKITRLNINCKNVSEQQKFYRETLGLKKINSTDNSFDVQIGYSILSFQESVNFYPYHIAFHIPDRTEEKALSWLKNRVDILCFEDQDIIDFKGWNAKSIYFYDEDHNIMEFISRRDFNGTSEEIFSEKSILGVSEIGLATNDIELKYNYLNEKCKLNIFDGNFEKFCAIGDDEGLLITINSRLKTWFPTGDKAYNSAFRIDFINNEKQYSLEYSGEELRILDPLANI